MAKLKKKANGNLYIVGTPIIDGSSKRGNFCTWQVTPAGCQLLASHGVKPEHPVPPDVFKQLKKHDYIYTGGGGIGPEGDELSPSIRQSNVSASHNSKGKQVLVLCPQCSMKLFPSELNGHLQRWHSATKQKLPSGSNTNVFPKCPICFVSVKKMEKHIRKAHPETLTPSASGPPPTESLQDAKQEVPNHALLTTCPICFVSIKINNKEKHMLKVHPKMGEQSPHVVTSQAHIQNDKNESKTALQPIYFPILELNKVGQNAIWEIIEVRWDEKEVFSGDNLVFVYAPHREKIISLETAKWVGIPNSKQPMRLRLPLPEEGEYWKAYITTEKYLLKCLNRLDGAKSPTWFYEYDDDACEADKNEVRYYTWYRWSL